ncbi:NUDIX hydrolase domain-like protein [Pholiota molesta]|nr:NUDIX hydrolase domain-like protein [Pholiota molesta]
MPDDLPRILETTDLPISEAKWITLKKATYLDQDGKQRVWEYAERKTRAKASGVDGVAVLAVIRSKTNAFPVSTILIEQYRPPIGKFLIELPAGLVDEGETVEAAAIRELREETGYIADEVLQMSPVIVADPGMTNANMQLAVISVTMEDKLETPVPQLDAGEHIVTRVVELAHLQDALNEYDKQGFVVNALVTHFAFGYTVAQQFK